MDTARYGALERCEVRRAAEKSPHVPIGGVSTVSMFTGELQVDLPLSDDIIALRVTDVYSEYTLSIPVRSKHPQEIRGAYCGGLRGVFGQPEGIQIDEGRNGRMKNRRTSARSAVPSPSSKRRGRYPWIRERRNGIARRIYNRPMADDRFPSKQIPSGVQWCLITLIPAGGYSACQMVFGSNPVDLFGRDDGDEDLLFAQDTYPSGQFVQQ